MKMLKKEAVSARPLPFSFKQDRFLLSKTARPLPFFI